jgi:hypothetical protein
MQPLNAAFHMMQLIDSGPESPVVRASSDRTTTTSASVRFLGCRSCPQPCHCTGLALPLRAERHRRPVSRAVWGLAALLLVWDRGPLLLPLQEGAARDEDRGLRISKGLRRRAAQPRPMTWAGLATRATAFYEMYVVVRHGSRASVLPSYRVACDSRSGGRPDSRSGGRPEASRWRLECAVGARRRRLQACGQTRFVRPTTRPAIPQWCYNTAQYILKCV